MRRDFLTSAQRLLCGRQGGPWQAILNPGFIAAWANWNINHRYAATGTVTAEAYGRWRQRAIQALIAAGLRSQAT